MPKETGHSRGRQIDWRKLFRAVTYVCVVAVHTALVVMGLTLQVGYGHFGYRLMNLLAGAFLAPVALGWIVVAAWLIKRARAGLGFPPRVRTLVVRPIIFAVAAWILYHGSVRIGYSHPWAERRAGLVGLQLGIVEMELRRFYYTYGRVPKDLEELADLLLRDEHAAASVYGDPFTGPGPSSEPLRYLQLDSTNVLLYSIGPDLDDDKGEKEFIEEHLHYHKGSREWRGMPFGNWLYEASGASAKLDGDITRRISLRRRGTSK